MLALIRTLGPIAAMLIGLAGGSTVLGAAAWLWNDFVDNPHVRELVRVEERAACQLRTLEAANAAEAAERARQQAIGRDALAAYRDAAAAHAALAQQAQDQLEAEIAKNEQDLVAQGRSCLLNDDDVVRLRGNAR